MSTKCKFCKKGLRPIKNEFDNREYHKVCWKTVSATADIKPLDSSDRFKPRPKQKVEKIEDLQADMMEFLEAGGHI